MVETRRRRAFSQIAGHPALDLVNTVEWRLAPERFEEDLLDFEDVVRWAEQVGLLDEGEAAAVRLGAGADDRTAEEEAAAVRSLRETIYAVSYSSADADGVLAAYRDAVAHGTLVQEGDGWAWALPVDLALPRRRIALEAFDLLTRTDVSRLAQCQDAECGWVFLDTSPRRNRRWCVSADCGNRNRVRDFYDRARAAAT